VVAQGVIIVLFGVARTKGTRVAHMLLWISTGVLALFGAYELWVGGRGLLYWR
jgi:hypothetical protein